MRINDVIKRKLIRNPYLELLVREVVSNVDIVDRLRNKKRQEKLADLYIDAIRRLKKSKNTLWWSDFANPSSARGSDIGMYDDKEVTYIIDPPKVPTGPMASIESICEEIAQEHSQEFVKFLKAKARRLTTRLARDLKLTSSEEYFALHRDVEARIIGNFYVNLQKGNYDEGIVYDFIPPYSSLLDEFSDFYGSEADA